jgi:hypothetical protein
VKRDIACDIVISHVMSRFSSCISSGPVGGEAI